MKFVKKHYITSFLKLPFRRSFRETFRDLPDTFRDPALLTFFCFFSFKQQKNKQTTNTPFPGSLGRASPAGNTKVGNPHLGPGPGPWA
jgi:hypothetical protein